MPIANLTEKFLRRMVEVGPFNLLRLAALEPQAQWSLFVKTGTCQLTQVVTSGELEELGDYHLVWYKPNKIGAGAWCSDGSPNYRLREYVDGLVMGSISMSARMSEIVDSLRGGLTKPIEIMAAADTTLGVSIIVDGTKRALAMQYLKRTDPPSLDRLFTSQYPVQIFRFRSPLASLLFPCDFLKLWLRASERSVYDP